ncbi:MAG: extracellular solute-binding protein [Bifidobacteriaceae bacterium]|jgi:lactose/L-arabinose transport system substrate-binding protein|nr:extracellular solute-binding protein [Bifidobacteriaceae bacterium]
MMHTTKVRKLIALAAALPLVAVMAACGDNGGDNGGTTGDGDSTGGNKLTVWCWDPAFNLYAMEEAEKIYQKDHPDFELEIVETPWDDLQTKLITLAQSKQTSELPDIFLMQNNAFQKNVISYPELFTAFTDSGLDYGQYPPGIVAYSTIDGVNYGVPFDNGAAIDALRTDVLAEAGYTIDDFTGITWEEYITLGKDILAKTNHPIMSGEAGGADLPMMMLQSAGASLFDADGNPTIVGNEALLKSIDIFKQLVDSGVMVQVNSWDEYISSFVNGTVAGTINGSWIIGSITTAQDQSGNWDITDLPKLEGVSGATNFSANGGSSWAVSSNADVDLAMDFLKATFAGSTELYDIILPSSGAVANWLPAGDSAVYGEPQEFFGGDAIFAKIIDFVAKVPSNNTGVFYYEARDAVSDAITQILGGADVTTALQEAQDIVEFAMQ